MNTDPVFDYTDLGAAPRDQSALAAASDVVSGVKCMEAQPISVESGQAIVQEIPAMLESDAANLSDQARRRRPAVIRLGRVKFDCPVCAYHTVLPVDQCGSAVRCLKCYSGIQVPDPRLKLASKNLNQSIESVLRPDGFAECVDVRHFGPWLSSLLPAFGPFVFRGGVVLILIGIVSVIWVTVEWAKSDRIARIDPVAAPVIHPEAQTVIAKAGEAVKQFLNASTVEEKGAFVTHQKETIPLMANWYARKPGAGSQPEAVLRESTIGFYPNPGEIFAVTKVPVEMPGFSLITYLVQHHSLDGARIDWVESVAYSPLSWSDLMKKVGLKKPVRMRLLASLDDYYNYRWQDETKYRCVRFHDPHTKEQLGFGYTLRSEGKALARLLPPARKSVLRPVTVDLLPDIHSSRTQQVEIVGGVLPGWKVQPIMEQPGSPPANGPSSTLQASDKPSGRGR